MTGGNDVRVHAIWASVVVVCVMLCLDGAVATTAAAGVAGGLGYVAGYGSAARRAIAPCPAAPP